MFQPNKLHSVYLFDGRQFNKVLLSYLNAFVSVPFSIEKVLNQVSIIDLFNLIKPIVKCIHKTRFKRKNINHTLKCDLKYYWFLGALLSISHNNY